MNWERAMVSRRHDGIGDLNRRLGWLSLFLGVATGLILGLWSFDGPAHAPAGFGNYGDLPRRLARLGHIAFFGLGFINIMVGRELPALALTERAAATASGCMNFANVLLPATLFVASIFPLAKYALPLPALAVFVALGMVATGVLTSQTEPGSAKGDENDRPSHGKRVAGADRPGHRHGRIASGS